MFDSSVAGLVVGVLLIRVGQLLLISGAVRSKNAADAAVRGVIDLAVAVLAAWAFAGVWLPTPSDGRTPWLDPSNIFGGPSALTPLVVLPAALLCSGGVLGATAERSRLMPNLVTTFLFAALLAPLTLRAAGWLLPRPAAAVDVLIATVGGGAAAWAAAAVVGPRKGKFNRDLSVNYVPGHGVLFQIAGLVLLAAGWGGLGSHAANTLLGFAAATLGGMAFARLRFGKTDVGLLAAAAVGGLAAATVADIPQASSRLGGIAAVVGGGLAGVVVPWVVIRVETRFRLDDVTGTAASLVVGGTIGLVVAVATRFRDPQFLTLVWTSALAWLLIATVFGGVTLAVAVIFASRRKLRVSESVEYDGLDLSQLDINAYPDFQQTMIKSHHLRQL